MIPYQPKYHTYVYGKPSTLLVEVRGLGLFSYVLLDSAPFWKNWGRVPFFASLTIASQTTVFDI